MKLNRATDHALRILVILAKEGKTFSAKKLAKVIGITPRYTMKIGSILRDQGYLSVTNGPYGGYTLEPDPAKITVYEIVTLIEGRLRIAKCDGGNTCTQEGHCALHAMYSSLEQTLALYLKACTIQDIAAKIEDK